MRIFKLRKHSEFVVGGVLLYFLFENSMTNSDSLFDLMVAGFLPISWVKLFSTAYGLSYIWFTWVFISFVTCVVIFSEILANSFSSASCFCVSVLVVIMTYHGSVLVLVYSRIWFLSGDTDIIWVFLQVEGRKHCHNVRVPWRGETHFKYVFE